jgi:integrase
MVMRKVGSMSEVTPIRNLKASYLEPKQVDRILDAATNPRNALLVRIPWRTGIKVGGLICLRIQDIDFNNRAIVIKSQKMRKKDGKVIERRRVVPIDQGTLDMIKEYLEWRKKFSYKGELLFPITRQRVNQIYWKLAQKAGIEEIGAPSVSQRRKLHPSVLRRSFAIHCIKHGMSIGRLQMILGYYSSTSTSVYLQYSLKDLHEDYDQVWENEGK